MLKHAVILASGKGSRLWPYTRIRSKALLKVANKEIIKYQVEHLIQLNFEDITIIVDQNVNQVSRLFQDIPNVTILEDKYKNGSSNALLNIENKNELLILFGDCHIQYEDLERLVKDNQTHSVLLSKIDDNVHDWIACSIDDEYIGLFGGHHRGNQLTHRCVAIKSNELLNNQCKVNPGYFDNLKVGVGSPNEYFIEVSVNDLIRKNINFKGIECKYETIDCDKPWHYLRANAVEATYKNEKLVQNEIDETSSIDSSTVLNGFIKVGKNSSISRNVCFMGNSIIGNNVVMDNNVVIGKNCVIGDNTTIKNGVKLADNCVIGCDCKLDQTFEMIGGVLMDHVYCVHYGEYYGCIGSNSDLGAGTTCGTLRFDDGETAHIVNGRREVPKHYSNVTYLGDYTRTGICAMLMPGVKVGVNSIVGSGVILNEDVEDNTLIQAEQKLIKKTWSNSKYGW